MHNIHDTIFKENFSKKENAIDLIKTFLPENICKNIDFNTFNPENNSYTDKKLKKYFSDLIYTCFGYLLIYLSKYSDDEIKDRLFNTIENKILMNIMKNIFDDDKIIERNFP